MAVSRIGRDGFYGVIGRLLQRDRCFVSSVLSDLYLVKLL